MCGMDRERVVSAQVNPYVGRRKIDRVKDIRKYLEVRSDGIDIFRYRT